MKVKKVQKLNVAYVTLKKGRIIRTVEIHPGILIDLNAAGEPVGIEILALSKLAPALKILSSKKKAA